MHVAGAFVVMLFVILYKIGDALCGTMTGPFLVALGFGKLEIANIVKTYGLVASIVGVFAGGTFVRKLGIMRALWIAGFLQLASNLVFMAQAHIGHSSGFLALTRFARRACCVFSEGQSAVPSFSTQPSLVIDSSSKRSATTTKPPSVLGNAACVRSPALSTP